MIAILKRAIAPAVLALAATCGSALANASPLGLWYDETGRGAIEITECNGNLCGRLVWLKEADHKEGCGLQIFGDVKPVAGGKWDDGWIIDPEKDLKTRYDVEITPQGDKLKVMGYAGTKFLSQTMIWTRAPASLPQMRCKRQCPVRPETGADEERRAADRLSAPASHAGSIRKPRPAQAPLNATPPAAAKPGKDCKIEFGGVTLVVPLPRVRIARTAEAGCAAGAGAPSDLEPSSGSKTVAARSRPA